MVLFYILFLTISSVLGCPKNAYTNSEGICVCIEGYAGDDCEYYVGECIYLCKYCDGPEMAHCQMCIANAVMNSHGVCECNEEFTGADCSIHKESGQQCSPLCFEGCSGLTAFDCLYCVSRAHRTSNGECVWDLNWTGDSCDTYVTNETQCHARCSACTGGTIYDCTRCTDHSSFNQYGMCICNPGWSGHDCSTRGRYEGQCAPTCLDCHGEFDFECISCVPNSTKNKFGSCECDTVIWGGTHCEIYLSGCDHKCSLDCTGPTEFDCLTCIQNAQMDTNGACSCKEGWDGEDCSLWNYECHPLCFGCHGPELEDCDYCVTNAKMNFEGVCECKRFWSGPECRTYNYDGPCDSMCAECFGPQEDDCLACIENAEYSPQGLCLCKQYWSGETCEKYKFTGSCNPICAGGCVGPGMSDCIQCVSHAYRNQMGECVCEQFFSGEDCETQLNIEECHPLCDIHLGCTGPYADDCVACVPHAHKDQGACICDLFWTGDKCELYIREGCDPKCNGCTGPSACECLECVAHSHKSGRDCCVCDNFWAGADCGIYMAPCDPICDGCHGETAYDCEYCVENAHYNTELQYCECDENYIGEDCAKYTGPCDHKCTFCYGPSDSDCYGWIERAHFDDNDNCICDDWHTGWECDDYIGHCHPVCKKCHGPERSQCSECVENAYRSKDNDACHCNENWAGDSCTEYVGVCHENCNGCKGPSPYDCHLCVKHAHKNAHGGCDCDEFWSGASCSDYDGQCSSKCIGCHGSTARDCDQCVQNSYRNHQGVCECSIDWKDDDCDTYAGQCDYICSGGCTGPMASDCSYCADNATLNGQYECQCNEGWTGTGCDLYFGKCSPRCQGCKGPGTNHCDRCAPNSYRDFEGICICDSNWIGESCETYVGLCSSVCSTCSGPGEDQCVECAENAIKVRRGKCECKHNWGSADCSLYTGPCSPMCGYVCYGPSSSDCIRCATNAVETFLGECECQHPFGGPACDQFWGDCDAKCEGCYHEGPESCVACVENAKRDEDGVCVCQDNWLGESCDIFSNCDLKCQSNLCRGEGPAMCVTCNENSNRNSKGECVCSSGWTGESCADYNGTCNGKCISCHGPTASDCIGCVQNAKLDADQECVCKEWWTGDRCQVYRGRCNAICANCHGPSETDCIHCVENAFRNARGECECVDGWIGDDCHQVKHQCSENCQHCVGVKLGDCTQCMPGYTLEEGFCLPCDEGCRTCNGIGTASCLSCLSGYFLMNYNCTPCEPTCKECNGLQADQCLHCHEDSTLFDSTGLEVGVCKCNKPKFRHPSSAICINTCPTGFVSSGATCVLDHKFYLKFLFGESLPYYNYSVYAESCHPPVLLGSRGAYFDGIASFIDLTNFEVFQTFTIEVMFKLINPGTIFSFDASVLNVESGDEFGSLVSLGINECGEYQVFMWPPSKISSEKQSYSMSTWVSATLKMENDFQGTALKIYVNGSVKLESQFKNHNIVSADYTKTPKVMVGSLSGYSFLNGYIYGLVYSPYDAMTYFDSIQIPDCPYNQYVADDGGCVDCNESCASGCTDGNSCSDCHKDCNHCIGPRADQCIHCYCNASKSKPSEVTSSCECNIGLMGHPSQCTAIECDAGCKYCDHGYCLECGAGYQWVSFECKRCNDTGFQVQSQVPQCQVKTFAQNTGECTCSSPKVYDGYRCRECPENCRTCTGQFSDFHCEQCEGGFLFLPNSDICSDIGATGLYEDPLSDQWLLEYPVQVEFVFDEDGQFQDVQIEKDEDSIHLYGQEIEFHGYEVRIPFGHERRGLWFDGKYSVLMTEGLILYHTGSLECWISPESEGSLFSSSKSKSENWHFGLEEGHLEFENNTYEIKTTNSVITWQKWQHVAYTYEYSRQDRTTLIKFWHNAQISEHKLLVDYLSDWEDDISFHIIGAVVRDDVFSSLYRGYIFSMRFWASVQHGFTESVKHNCHGCDICPETSVCLTMECEWNEFFNGEDCQRCPNYCRDGCYGESGVCPTNS